jgi:hypothetical protein
MVSAEMELGIKRDNIRGGRIYIIKILTNFTVYLVKVKVVPVPKHHAMKMYWGGMYSSTHSLTSELDVGE